MTRLGFAINLAMINDALFVQRGRRDEHEEVVAAACLDFASGNRMKLRRGRVIDNDLGVVLRAPFHRKDLLKPAVIGLDRMFPLENPELFF